MSEEGLLQGAALLDQVVALTGLPESLVRPEIDRIIQQLGFSTEGLTLAQFREVLGAYLEQVTQALDFDMKLDG